MCLYDGCSICYFSDEDRIQSSVEISRLRLPERVRNDLPGKYVWSISASQDLGHIVRTLMLFSGSAVLQGRSLLWDECG